MSTVTVKTGQPSALAEFWHYFSRNKGAVIGLVVFTIILVVAVLAPLFAPHEPNEQNRAVLLAVPFWMEGGSASFPLGTDAVGRDILSRLIYGARFSLFIGVVVVTLSVISGVLIGLVAGFFRGKVDTAIMRLMDIILAFPSLLLALVLVAVLGPGLTNAMIAISLVNQPHFVRLTRASVISEREKEYVIASRVAVRHLPVDVQDDPAELSGPTDRSGDARLLGGDSRCRRPRLSRHGRPAADARMGDDAGRIP